MVIEEIQGLVIRTHGGHYYVQAQGNLYDCTLRGRLKRNQSGSDLIAIGDQVMLLPAPDDHAAISRVLPRKSAFSRCPPPPRRPVEQVMVANPDQVLIVFAACAPPLNPLMLDRFLVASEAAGLPALIAINKIELADSLEIDPIRQLYTGIGYSVYPVSANTGMGLDALRSQLEGKLTVLVGPSGVGKSSLLNAWWPELAMPTGEISLYHDRGKHTTVVAELLHPEDTIYVADTPGLRQLRFWRVTPANLENLFPEFRPWLGGCEYSPCAHLQEEDCAVRNAVASGAIAASRYDSYRRMYEFGF
ncbi:MAG: ribosome small subunit-dependent GTPase A [Anaerolineae bacterium]